MHCQPDFSRWPPPFMHIWRMHTTREQSSIQWEQRKLASGVVRVVNCVTEEHWEHCAATSFCSIKQQQCWWLRVSIAPCLASVQLIILWPSFHFTGSLTKWKGLLWKIRNSHLSFASCLRQHWHKIAKHHQLVSCGGGCSRLLLKNSIKLNTANPESTWTLPCSSSPSIVAPHNGAYLFSILLGSFCMLYILIVDKY